MKKLFTLSTSFRPERLLETAWRSKDPHQFFRENWMQIPMSSQHWVLLCTLVNERKNFQTILTLYMRRIDGDCLCAMF